MSTITPIDERLIRHSQLTEKIAESLLLLLIENYNSDNLSLGDNNAEIISEVEIYYTCVGSEFENEFLTLRYKDVEFGSPYDIIFECRGNDSTSELIINLSDEMVDKIPETMKKKISNKVFEVLDK